MDIILKTSSFRVSDIVQDVYLSDVPNTNRETGSLFLFTVPSPNSTTSNYCKKKCWKYKL